MLVKVNPPTAYNMLHDFARLVEGDWIIQNGANSAVCMKFYSCAGSIPYISLFLRLVKP